MLHNKPINAVIYYIDEYKRVNGSLYYALEHFQYIENKNTYMIFVSKYNNEQLIKNIINDKYNYNSDNIIFCKRLDLYKYNIRKAMFVDIRSYGRCRAFVSGEHHVYSNELHDNYRAPGGTTYYGYYDYQLYDVKVPLCLNFKYQKTFKNTKGTYISFRLIDDATINKIKETHPLDKFYIKDDVNIIDSLFDKIDTVIYLHTLLDTNNRIIVEAVYHGKQLIIKNLVDIQDSTVGRYNDIMNGKIHKYIISDNAFTRPFLENI